MSEPSPRAGARALAVRVLRQIDQRRGFSNRILADHLARSGLDRRDRGLCTALVYGVLRGQARLDALIDGALHREGSVRGQVREILRVAAFELRELDHPPHAAISEALRLCRGLAGGGSLAALAQAVLRTIADRGPELDQALEAGRPLDVLERRWSIPRWLAGRWIKALGPERALARARALALAPAIDLRIDLARADAATIQARLAADDPSASIVALPGQPQALRVRGGGDLSRSPLHAEGLFSIQSLGSQQPAILLDPRPGERILDACAGMGVKTLQLVERMGRRGEIVAVDLSDERLAEHAALARRGGFDTPGLQVRSITGDLCGSIPGVDDGEPFTGVLLDAPCTGLGNLARHPELRWTRRYEDIGACAELQARLLDACWARVAAGGRLVYAVCSLEPEEGPALVRAFAAERGLEIGGEAEYTPEGDGCDGFYLARLSRP